MKLVELFESHAEPIEQRSIVRGIISTNRPAPTGFPVEGSEANWLWVIVPGYSPEAPLGPCNWAAIHGSTLPARGAACVVAFDEANRPVVVWWEGNNSSALSIASTYEAPTYSRVAGVEHEASAVENVQVTLVVYMHTKTEEEPTVKVGGVVVSAAGTAGSTTATVKPSVGCTFICPRGKKWEVEDGEHVISVLSQYLGIG